MEEQDLYKLPVHGPEGRIAVLRRVLRMKQAEFAEAVGTSRETVSHWENVDENGEPRQRTTRKNAASIAVLAREKLLWTVGSDVFYGAGESAWDALRREADAQAKRTAEMAEQLDRALELLSQISERLDR